MKRKSHRHAAVAAAKLIEIQALAPAVMARRLSSLDGLAPWQSAFAWNRWATEKAFAFSLVGIELMQAAAQAWAAGASASQLTQHGARAAARALAPLHRRVKRNARRKRD